MMWAVMLCAGAWVLCAGQAKGRDATPRAKKPPAAAGAPRTRPARNLGPTPESVMEVHPPTHLNVAYGPHKRNILNMWLVKSDQPTPLVIRIHGGGFMSGGPTPPVMLEEYLKAGISVGSITYRFSTEAPFPAQMLDGARAVQFLRSKAKEWNLDTTRFGAMGGSSGAGISLWLGFHDDMANPNGADPIERESTRLACMAVNQAQISYDPRWIRQNIPGPGWRVGPLWQLYGLKAPTAEMPEISPAVGKLMEEASPINYLTKDDAPVRIIFITDDIEGRLDENGSIHHARNGSILKKKMDELGIPCELTLKAAAKEVPEDVTYFVKQFARPNPPPTSSKGNN